MKSKYTFTGITFRGDRYDHSTEAVSYGSALNKTVTYLGFKNNLKLNKEDYAKEISYLRKNLENGYGSVRCEPLPVKPTQTELF